MAQRLFIAVPLPAEEHTRIADIQAQLRSQAPEIRIPTSAALHLTLKFLGDVEDAQVPALTEALGEVGESQAGFTWTLGGYGMFPDRGPPRVVWVGVAEGAETFVTLADALEAACEPLGFARERRVFHPHFTLGRVRVGKHWGRNVDGGSKALRGRIQQALADLPPGPGDPLPGARLILYRSELSPAGARYTPLAEAPLRSPRDAGT